MTAEPNPADAPRLSPGAVSNARRVSAVDRLVAAIRARAPVWDVFADTHNLDADALIKEAGWTDSRRQLDHYVAALCGERRHPVRDYLDGLKWDGRPRIDRWLTTCLGVPDTELARAQGRLWIIGAVRRIRQPGSKFDECLVLEGHQASDALRALVPRPDWFSEKAPLGERDADLARALHGRWIVQVVGLDRMTQRAAETMKAQLSRDTDRGTLRWERIGRIVDRPRQCVFCATVDRSSLSSVPRRYLFSKKGNRRFWPVWARSIDLAALVRDRDQLWAEAAALEAAGAPSRLDEALFKAAEVEQRQRTLVIWDQALAELLKDRDKVASTEVWECLGIAPAQRRKFDYRNQLGVEMRRLGWERPRTKGGQRKIGGKLVTVWVRIGPPRPLWELGRDAKAE